MTTRIVEMALKGQNWFYKRTWAGEDWTLATGGFFMHGTLGVSGGYVTDVHIPIPAEPDREYLVTCKDEEIVSVVLVDFDMNGNVIAKTDVTEFSFECMCY